LHSLFSGKDRDLKIQRQRVLYRGLTFLLNHNKYNFFFLDLQMLLKVVFGCVQGRRRMSRLYTLAHIRELPFLCV
ncbi:hypothetical protein, partial [Bacteroides thetaiotaomicron]